MKKIKKISFPIMLFLFLYGCKERPQELFSIQIDDKERAYILYLPEHLSEQAPLVFVFHGYSGSAEGIRNSFDFDKVADENGFAVCYPKGWIDKKENHFWQVGYKMHQDIEINDVKFVSTLAGQLQEKYNLSKENTFIIGFSNGGDFCNLLLCQTSGIFKAAAPIISCMMKDMYDACQDSNPVPIFMLNGTKDDITYWEGDMEDKQGYGPYLSTMAMLDFRLAQNECTLMSTRTIESPNSADNRSIKIEKYVNGGTKNDIWMHTVINGGHGHPEYFDLGNEIWDFFSAYLHPSPGN